MLGGIWVILRRIGKKNPRRTTYFGDKEVVAENRNSDTVKFGFHWKTDNFNQ